MNNTWIPVFFTISDDYAPYAAVAVRSLLHNASPAYNYRIHIIHQGLSPESAANLKALETANSQIVLTEMRESLRGIEDCEETKLRCDYFTLTIYFRLFLADMFPEYDKGIYLDSDIVVPGDISQLYTLELGDNLVGACHDYSIENAPPLVHYVEEAVGVPIWQYVNSGVLLMNLKAMRQTRFGERFLETLNRFHFNCLAPDQDYLNAMCAGKILYLDKTWDTMPQRGAAEIPDPGIVHYNLFDKPWCYDDIPYQEIFWDYARRTPYNSLLRAQLDAYTQAQKAHDRQSMELMGQKALEIPEEPVTFRKMTEKGEQIRICF